MSRRIALNQKIAEALSPRLIHEMVEMIQSYTPLPDVVFAIGGRSFQCLFTSVERITFSTADAPNAADRVVACVEDEALALSSDARDSCTAAATNDRFYVLGGSDREYCLIRYVEERHPFDFSTGAEHCPNVPRNCVSGAIVCARNAMYLFGGADPNDAESCVWRFDTTRRESSGDDASAGWVALKAGLKTTRTGCEACLSWDGRTIYIAGTNSGETSDLDVFDVETETMQQAVALPANRPTYAAMCYYRDALWFMGGCTTASSGETEVTDVKRFSLSTPATDGSAAQWSSEAPLRQARSHARACVVDHVVFVIGGRATAERSLNSIEAYDADANVWVVQNASLSSQRYDFAIAHCY